MKVEKLIKSEGVKFGSLTLITTILIRAINLISVPIFARILTTYEYGRADIFFSYANLIYILIGINGFGVIEIAFLQYKEKINEYISSTINMVIANGFVYFCISNILFCFKDEIFGMKQFEFNLLLLYSFAIFIVAYKNTEYVYRIEYKKNFILSLSVLLANIILSVVLIFAKFISDNYYARVLGAIIPTLIISVWLVLEYEKKGKCIFGTDYTRFTLKYAIPLIPHTLSLILLSNADKLMVKSYFGASKAAIYAIVYTIGLLLNVMVEGFNKISLPIVFRELEKKNYEMVILFQNILSSLFCLISTAVLAVSPELVLIIGGKEYEEGKTFVLWITMSTILIFFYYLYYNIEYYHKNTKVIAIGTIFATVINLMLNFLLLQKMGYKFAAITTIISYIFLLIFNMVNVNFVIKKKYVDNVCVVVLVTIMFCLTIFMQLNISNLIIRITICCIFAIGFGVYSLFLIKKYLKIKKCIKE